MGIRLIFRNYDRCVITQGVTQEGKPTGKGISRGKTVGRIDRQIRRSVELKVETSAGNRAKWPNHTAKKNLVGSVYRNRTSNRHR
jgi:hypothetical protein